MTDGELKALCASFPIGSLVYDPGADPQGFNVFQVVGYWRTDVRVESPEYGTTHCVDPRHLARC